MIPATPGWRAVFLLFEHGGVSRQVAFWCIEGEEAFGVVADDDGRLEPAHALDGFAGYVDPDDDPEKLISAARRRAKEEASTPAKKEASTPAKKEASTPAKKEASTPAKKEASTPAKEKETTT